jgi:hypothetical protein
MSIYATWGFHLCRGILSTLHSMSKVSSPRPQRSDLHSAFPIIQVNLSFELERRSAVMRNEAISTNIGKVAILS